MLLLGIDTSTKKGILCLGTREKILARKTISSGLCSRELISALDTLMKSQKIKKEDLEAVVASLGPGSFTGLRVGLSLAKSLAFVLRIPLVGIATLDSWVFYLRHEGVFCALRRAYRGRFYVGFYQKDQGKIEKIDKCRFLSLDGIQQSLRKFFPQKVTFLIPAEEREITAELKKIKNTSFLLLDEIFLIKALIALGAERLKTRKTDSVLSLSPLYVSPPEVRIGRGNKDSRHEERGYPGS
ncbi:MAG: tRNA (adenosine(37)-N6)-threonylcarbamoyltransferase complex dimerization subunit type 1 TsaB [bacterium]